MGTERAWHVAGPDGGPPEPSYKYHIYRDCSMLERITRLEPHRLRTGTAGLEECFNCREREARRGGDRR